MFDEANGNEEHVCPQCGALHTHKVSWSWPKFVIGKLSNKFIAWAVYMVFQFMILFMPAQITPSFNPAEYARLIIIISAIVTIIFTLAGALDVAVSNMKMTAAFEAKYGVTKDIKKESKK